MVVAVNNAENKPKPPENQAAASDMPKAQPDVSNAPDWAKKLGHFAFEHRDHFNSTTGSILWRNIAKGTVAWVPTVVAFTGNRYLFKALREEAKLGHYLAPKAKEILAKPYLGLAIENTSFVVAGFTTYRSFIKFWQRAYDRVFKDAKTEAEAIDAVAHIPTNIIPDAKDIIPHEFSSTFLAAPILACVRLGLNPPAGGLAPAALDGNFAAAKAGYLHDLTAATVAYSAFFEANDRAYANISGGKDPVDKMYSPVKDPAHYGEKKKFGFFTDDGVGRIVFRRVGSVLAGFAPYLAVQRYSRAKVGDVKAFEHSFLKNLTKEYSNHVAFCLYTAEAELYGKAYDRLFEKLEAKEKSPSLN
ncbi:MAG: hypothetical protein SFW63_02390 [Alphaproteobacteria bacterium]|nr:hypothetical protein [Alphaproteobacteria bacterium]